MQRGRGVLIVVAVLATAAFGHAGSARAANPPAIKVEIIGQGTVTGAGISCGLGSLTCYSSYGSTAAVALTAAPASGWTFSGWQDDAGSCGATAANCSVTPGATTTATAVFTTTGPVQASTLGVALSTSGSPAAANGGVTDGSASAPIDCSDSASQCRVTLDQGSTITLVEAPSDTSHFFSGWGGACGGSGVSCSVYLGSDQFVTATFAANAPNTLTVSVAGNGSVAGGGITCGAGASCNAPEPPNATVTLTATPQSGYVLTGWSGSCTGTQSTCVVQMNAARTVTATFAQVVTLAVTVTGNGYVSGGGIGCDGRPAGQTCTATEAPNTVVTLTAHPNDSGGSVIWSGCTSTAGNFCTLTVSTAAVAVSASFSGGVTPPVATNSLFLGVSGDGYVTSFGGGSSIYCTAAGGSGCSANVQANTTITLTAVPASGASANFTGWGGDCSGFISTTCTLTMSSSKTVQASFAGGNTTYVLSSQVSGSGTVSGAGLNCSGSGVGCSAAQAAGATVTLTATPGFGATFAGWSGACSGTSTICTVGMTNAKSVTASFSSSFGGTGSGLSISVSGAGAVHGPGGVCSSTNGKTKFCSQPAGSGTVTLTARPAPGFALSAWSGACSGEKATCDVTSASGRSVGATFVELALAATHKPTVVRTKTGYRITLWFHSGTSGRLAVSATRSGTRVVRHTVAVKAGGRHVLVTVSRRGRYVVTVSLAGHSLRWRVKV